MITRIIKLSLPVILLAGLLAACENEEIGYYKEGHDAIRFPSKELYAGEAAGYDGGSRHFVGTLSFIENPFASDTIYDLPVMLIGNAAGHDRKVSYTIDQEKSTAPTGSYEVLDAVIPADSMTGYIRFRLYNAEELDDASYEVYLSLNASDEFAVGPPNYVNAYLLWNNMIPAPTNTNHIRTYNMMIRGTANFVSTSLSHYSPRALKAIVAALEWNDWDDINARGSKYNPPSVGSYKYLPRYSMIYSDNSYKSYALKLAHYIAAYNAAHPDAPLVHDAGAFVGQPIEARSY